MKISAIHAPLPHSQIALQVGILYDAPAMLCDLRLNELPDMRLEPLVCPLLVRPHQPRIAGHIGGESSLYTDRERAALGWTEALTRIAETHAPDATYDEVRRHFEDKELVDLTTLIGLINLWNRLAIGFRYQHPVD
jgi:alkylhydroperoxidase family enzyme